MTSTPDVSSRLTDTNGRLTETWAAFFKTLVRSQTSFNGSVQSLTTAKASVSQDFAEAMLVEFPVNKDYTFVALAINGTIDEVVTQAESGSCTVTVKINGQPIGGSANSANTTKSSTSHTANNELETDDDVTVTVSANSSCEGLSVTLRGTRTLA